MQSKQYLNEIKKMLEKHDDLYYNKDCPEISDEEYDSLKSKYLELSNQEEYGYVPGDALFNKYEHSHPIKSLQKINSISDLKTKMKELAPFVIQPKLDGLTIICYPGTTTEKGKFVTRGNGLIGEDIFNNAIKIDGINKVSKGLDSPVRIEAIMTKSMFNAINDERNEEDKFKNPRNAAAGILRNKDSEKVKGLSYFAYNIIGSEMSESRQLDILKEYNFNIVDCFKNSNGSIVYEECDIDYAIEQIEKFDRHSLDYEIDGLVIKSNKENALTIYGETSHHPKNMIAYKFPAEKVKTKILDIIYQVKRTGKVTPVALLEPVYIQGSTVSRATLHNEAYIKSLDLRENSIVTLIKSNDIIPAIIDSENGGKEFEFTKMCPECKSELKMVNDQHFCFNVECKAKLVYNICHMALREALDITGLSEETADKIVEAGLVNSIFDIFKLTKDDLLLLDGFAEKSAQKLINNIKKSTDTSLKQFLYAAGIPLVGKTMSSDIASNLYTIENIILDIENGCEKISQIYGIGENSIDSLKMNKNILIELLKHVKPKEEKSIAISNNQMTFVVTGTMSVPRKDIEEIIRRSGHKVSSSVSKNTNYVVVGEDAGSKLQKAKDLNVKIIFEDQLEAILNGK